ncbi:hypothetical protein Tco_1321073 [Tanacetum coccineum]
MSDVERVDMGSQAEASSSSKHDMGSYISTMKPSDVKALTRKYKIPRDLHPVAVSSKWTMDRLTDEYIGLYEQYFEFVGLRLISDPAPKDGFDEADVIALTHQSIDIRGILSGLLFSAGFAITWEFPKFRPLFKDPKGHVVIMSEYLRLPFLSGMTIEAREALTERNVIPQHTTTPLSADEQVPEKTDSQQRVEVLDPKIVATRIRKVKAAAKRKVEKNMESEGAGGSEGSLKRRKPSSGPEGGDKEKSSDHIPCHTPLRTIVAVTSDVSRGGNAISPTQSQGDICLRFLRMTPHCLEGSDRHVSETTKRVVIETESIPTAATRPDNGKSIAQEETPMPDPPLQGIHQRSRVTTPEECRDLMVNLIPLGVREEMNLLDNNVILDRAWFSLARGAMAQAHAICQFESLYDTHHALQESLETTRGQLVRTREDFNVVQNFYNTLSGKHRQNPRWHARVLGLAHLESQLVRKTMALVYAEKDSRKLLPTVVERLLQSHEYKQSLFVPFNYALQTEWGQGLVRSVGVRMELPTDNDEVIMKGFDPYSDTR